MPASVSGAFEVGAGTGPDATYLLVASVGCAMAVLWLIWFTISAYREWMKGIVDDDVMAWSFIRGLMVAVIFWVVPAMTEQAL